MRIGHRLRGLTLRVLKAPSGGDTYHLPLPQWMMLVGYCPFSATSCPGVSLNVTSRWEAGNGLLPTTRLSKLVSHPFVLLMVTSAQGTVHPVSRALN